MKRNFDAILKTLDGEDFKVENGAPLTLKKVCIGALGGALPGDDQMDGERKFGLYKLADRINKGGLVDVTAEEIAALKARIARSYTVFAIGAAYTLLETEPAAEVPAKAAEPLADAA